MKYSYSSANLSLADIFKALFINKNKAIETIEVFFKELTGKDYILITNSCRSALCIAYKALGKKGEVITSPLTCKVAIDPIKESGNIPVYSDIQIKDLNIDCYDIEPRINENTIAIQPIHFGGSPCNMDMVSKLAIKYDLLIIEDCAQALGANFQGTNAGSFGDIACFTLTKNAYGLGGGILATNSKKLYSKAVKYSQQLHKPSTVIIIYRIIRNIIHNFRDNVLGSLLYDSLMRLRKEKQGNNSTKEQLCQITSLEIKIAAKQLNRIDCLHKKRKEVGKNYYDELIKMGLIYNCYDSKLSSFTKFYIFNPDFNAIKYIKELNKFGIEAMHLEHKYGSPYQEPLTPIINAKVNRLDNYRNVHDSVISLPLQESMNENDTKDIVSTLGVIHEKLKAQAN